MDIELRNSFQSGLIGMGEMAESILADLEKLGEPVPQELLDELDREIARNAEANRLAKKRQEEAKEAQER